MTRHPGLGYEFRVYQKILRLAGADQLHVNGVQGKFWERDDSVIASAASCLAPFAGVSPIMPVFSSGQWAGLAPMIHAKLKKNRCAVVLHIGCKIRSCLLLPSRFKRSAVFLLGKLCLLGRHF
jgi:ribulose 1,5-bisphosphate carboxylase large subunit-like protein